MPVTNLEMSAFTIQGDMGVLTCIWLFVFRQAASSAQLQLHTFYLLAKVPEIPAKNKKFLLLSFYSCTFVLE